MSLRFSVKLVRAGEDGEYKSSLFEAAYSECLESGVMDRRKWIEMNLEIMRSEDRLEFAILDGDTLVGGLTLTEEMDAHVGPCVAVRYNYILPKYRSRRVGSVVMRHAIILAAKLGPPYIAFTHRKGEGLYTLRYRRLHEAEVEQIT